jgi:hypothetical protein
VSPADAGSSRPGGVTPGRAGRRSRERRSRRLEIVVTALVVGVGLFIAIGEAAHPGRYAPAAIATGSAGPEHAADLVALSVTGTDHPLLAVVGAGHGHEPTFLTVPTSATLVVPGQAETTAGELSLLPAETVQVGLSNAIGGWVDHVATMTPDGLASVVDRAGGITVSVIGSYDLDGRTVGPGEARLDGDEVATLLERHGKDALSRWQAVLTGLLAQRISLQEADLAEVDDLRAVNDVLREAVGAEQLRFPTKRLGFGLVVPRYDTLDPLVEEVFGFSPPIPTIVENGSGRPGVGEPVARRLLPLGFRVVLSRNAESFDHEVTQILAVQKGHVDDAQRVRRALGVGRVRLTRVPSGIGDVVIVVGKDFQA